METQDYKEMRDVVSRVKYMVRTREETPLEIFTSYQPAIGREIIHLLRDHYPEVLKEKMKNPKKFQKELMKINKLYYLKVRELTDAGMVFTEIPYESKKYAIGLFKL